MSERRDLAAEVERIRLEVAKQFDHVANRDNCSTLLLHIAALSRELEELRRPVQSQDDSFSCDDGNCLSQQCTKCAVDPNGDDPKAYEGTGFYAPAEISTELSAIAKGADEQAESIEKSWREHCRQIKADPERFSSANPTVVINYLISALDQAQREIVETEGHLADSRTESECLTKELSRLHEEHREVTAERDLYRDNSVFLQGQVEVHRQSSKREMHLAHEAAKESERLRAEIARLSSPPQERGEVVERQAVRKKAQSNYFLLTHEQQSESVADIDTLLGDCAAWRNAHALVTAERDQLKAAKLKHDSQQRVAALALHDERIERLEGVLRTLIEELNRRVVGLVTWDEDGAVGPVEVELSWESIARLALDYTKASSSRALSALAAADGRQQISSAYECPSDECPMCANEACNKCGAGCWAPIGSTNCEHDVTERHEQPSATGDGVEGE